MKYREKKSGDWKSDNTSLTCPDCSHSVRDWGNIEFIQSKFGQEPIIQAENFRLHGNEVTFDWKCDKCKEYFSVHSKIFKLTRYDDDAKEFYVDNEIPFTNGLF
jgi:hypothetical protein